MKPDKSKDEPRGVSKRKISWTEFYRQTGRTPPEPPTEEVTADTGPEPPALPPDMTEPVIEEPAAEPGPAMEDVVPPVVVPEPVVETPEEPQPTVEEPVVEPEDAFPSLLAWLKDKERAREFGPIVRAYLRPRHVSQKDAATAMGYANRGVFNNVLDGRTPWNELRLQQLCDFLGVDAATLLKQAR